MKTVGIKLEAVSILTDEALEKGGEFVIEAHHGLVTAAMARMVLYGDQYAMVPPDELAEYKLLQERLLRHVQVRDFEWPEEAS